MAAIAGQLGVRLEKPGAYVLNASERVPEATDLEAARRLVLTAMFGSAALSVLLRAWHAHD
jgi:cobalamin biosynthesis protein CobD/CbiB